MVNKKEFIKMKKLLMLGVAGYLAFNPLMAAGAATQTEPNGADIEKNIEVILGDLKGRESSETIARLTKLAEQIKAMNDARHEFSEALKIILVNLMGELKEMATSAEKMDAIAAVVGAPKAATPTSNAEPQAAEPSEEEGEAQPEGEEQSQGEEENNDGGN